MRKTTPAYPLGSPPRMRGEEVLGRWCVTSSRITPAHAGRSHGTSELSDVLRDHPRACGEKLFLKPIPRTGQGSPPRMRGEDGVDINHIWQLGITPAHAGRSGNLKRGKNHEKDHPRACGEKNSTHPQSRNQRGSPPRMRGEGGRRSTMPIRDRITPAHAGRRSGQAVHAYAARDHPRACGEKCGK